MQVPNVFANLGSPVTPNINPMQAAVVQPKQSDNTEILKQQAILQDMTKKFKPLEDSILPLLQKGKVEEANIAVDIFSKIYKDDQGIQAALQAFKGVDIPIKVESQGRGKDPETGEIVTYSVDSSGRIVQKTNTGLLPIGTKTEEEMERDILVTKEKSQISEEKEMRMARNARLTSAGSRFQASVGGRDALDEALTILGNNPNVHKNILGVLGLDTQGTKFQSLVQDSLSLEVLKRSGVAVNENEYRRLRKAFAPTLLNNAEVAKWKLERLRKIFQYSIDFQKSLDPIQFVEKHEDKRKAAQQALNDLINSEGTELTVNEEKDVLDRTEAYNRMLQAAKKRARELGEPLLLEEVEKIRKAAGF